MTRYRLVQAAAVAALAITAFVCWPDRVDGYTMGTIAFALLNILVALPRATGVRIASVAASLLGLAQPHGPGGVAMFFAWILWTPAVLMASASDGTPPAAADGDFEGAAAGLPARIRVAAIIVAVAIAAIAYQFIVLHRLQQTAALFIGLPALLAIVVVLGVSPRSATGVACKAVTVGLLVSLMFLGEGILCVLMSAPLFYLGAIVIGVSTDRLRQQRSGRARTTVSCLAVLAFVPMSLEGVMPWTSLNRDEEVTTTKIVGVSPDAIAGALLAAPRFDRTLPLYLRAGFPRPAAVQIDGTGVGSHWIVRLRGGEMRLDGMEPRAGDLVLRLEQLEPGIARWRAISDDSHMTHFLSWREAIVRWAPDGNGATRVTCTLRYRRDLDPSWYFGPWERYAVGLAAGYLIDAVATP